ncbi:MAG: hypothetical protein PUC09_08135 [Methanobrevibacter wolinii]|nr:hypothetical protein [Methanobrevibacter wolinii]
MKKVFILIVFLTLILSIGCSFATDSNDTNSIINDTTPIHDNSSLNAVNTDNNTLNEDSNISNPKTYEITEDNYNNYFNIKDGSFIENSTIKDGDVIKIGNVSDKRFTIDRPLNITSITNDDVITNGMIFLTEGSQGSNVTGLKFKNNLTYYSNNNRIQLIPIVAKNTHNLYIYNNTIESTANFAVGLANLTNSKIDHNNFSTYDKNYDVLWGGKSTFLIHASSNNTISNNEFTSSAANCINFNAVAQYTDIWIQRNIYSENNIIENNIINGNGKNLAMCWLINLNQNRNTKIGFTIIRNNTLINGNKGINAPSIDNGVEIINNTIIDCKEGIVVSSKSLVENNTINVDNTAINSYENVTIRNNNITSKNTGLIISKPDVKVLNNNINSDVAIKVSSNNITFENNTINSNYGIMGGNANLNNISIINNTINTEDSAIYLSGKINSVNITQNKINTNNNASTCIFINGSNNSEITNNNIKTNYEYTIESEDNIPIKDNYLISKKYVGNKAVNVKNGEVKHNYPKTVTIDYQDNKGNIIVNLIDDENNPVNNKTITYIINGTSPKNLTTDKNGQANIGKIRGKADLTVIFATEDKNYVNSTDSITIKNYNTYRENTKIVSHDFNQVAVDFYHGERGGYFVSQLLDANNNPLANKTVQVGFNGVVYTLTTDENGLAKLQINLAWAGIYTFAVCYLGDDDYNGSFVVNKITISKKPTSLVVPNKKYSLRTKSKVITVTIKGKKASGTGYTLGIGKTVKVTVNGKTYTAKTNSKGVANIKVNINRRGTYTVTTKFDGDYGFNSQKSTSKLIIV